jgi:hypothetical protein
MHKTDFVNVKNVKIKKIIEMLIFNVYETFQFYLTQPRFPGIAVTKIIRIGNKSKINNPHISKINLICAFLAQVLFSRND